MPYFSTIHRFHYTEKVNEGPIVLMIHSTGVGSWQWKPYFETMPSRHCITVDLLGYPPSDTFSSTFAIEADFEALGVLLSQQEKKVDIIGHSYGGFLAMQLAKKYPSSIRSLLLHEPVAWGALFDGNRIDLQKEFLALCDRFFQETSPQADKWLNVFIDYWNREGTWIALPERTKEIWRKQFDKVYAEVKHLCLDRTPLAYWETIEHPTWITLSKHAPAHEKEVCHLLSTTIPNAKLIHHKGGHLAPLTHFSEVAPIVEKWSKDQLS